MLIPLRQDIVVEYLEHEQEGPIYLPATVARDDYTRARVVALGPDVYDIELDDVVWILGCKSGIPYEEFHLVHQKICFLKEEK